MSLFEEEPEDELLAFINRRQRQILVHSCLYYRFDINLIPDHLYDFWSRELADLIVNHPQLFEQSAYHKDFIGFDGSTGFDLPIGRPEIERKAQLLFRYRPTNSL